MKMIRLRKYQDEQFVSCVDASERDVLVHSPTGSGKTVVAVAVAGHVATAENCCVIITTPQSDVEESFVRAVARGVYTSSGKIASEERVSRARDSSTSYAAIAEHLKSGFGKILLTTHAALVSAFTKDPVLSEAVSKNHLLIVDEFHHATSEDRADAPGTKIGKIVSGFRERHAKVVGFTATPFRSDSLDVTTKGTKVLFRSWVQHMEEGFCPRQVETSAVSFAGENDISIAAERMVETWKKHKRPKIVIRISHFPGKAEDNILAIKKRFETDGAKVLDVSGSKTEDICRIKGAMGHEESCQYVDSKYDVIIGCNRVREAFNWPHCCAVYCLGCPVSAQLSVQLMGRACRLKCRSCPAIWQDRAAMVFFVPYGTETGTDSVGRSHSARTMLMCGFLNDITNSHIFNEMNTRLKIAQSLPGTRRVTAIGLSEERMKMNLLIRAIQEKTVQNQVDITDAEVETFIRKNARKLGISNETRDSVIESLRRVAQTDEISDALSDAKDTFADAAEKYFGESKLLKAFSKSDVHQYLISLNSTAIKELGAMATKLILPLTQYERKELISAAFLTRRRY